MRFRVLSLLVAAAVFAGTAACDEALSDLTGPTPNLQPTFSSIQQEIEPRFDRAVFFPSWFPHEVLPVHCGSGAFADGRFAISCWVRKNLGRG